MGRWDQFHDGRPPAPYADTETYALGAAWLRDCAMVEDWGCGLGWARQFFRPGQYVGIDESQSPAVNRMVDLSVYRSCVDGIFMRHVLEHNENWQLILHNAVTSFTQRMALILFTPMDAVTRQIAWNPGYEVPDIAFAPADLESRFGRGVSFRVEDLRTASQYGVERVYYLER